MAKRRLAMILPSLGRVQRGAETAFLELARALNRNQELEVTLFGSGRVGTDGLSLREVGCSPRERFERWPRMPGLRSESHYEELSFVWRLARGKDYRPADFDAVIACTYPYVNWFLQRAGGRSRPKQIFVTQNGDWPCRGLNREYRWFGCDGLVCINPEYYERHRHRYPSALIPNGVDPEVYRPRAALEDVEGMDGIPLPSGIPIVLMVSALIPAKRVADAVRAVARVPGACLAVAGDGPERGEVGKLAGELLPDRHVLLGALPRSAMPALYRRADVFLHMHQDEPFGIAYLEAAASGLAIVAPDAPTPRWILGEAALYADPGDPESAALALRQALEPKTRAALGQSARGRVEADWSWEAQAVKYRDFVEQVLNGRACPR